MQNTCPQCNTSYNITPQLMGQKVTCKKCGAALIVGAQGLQLASQASGAPVLLESVDESPPLITRPARTGSNFLADVWQRHGSELPTFFVMGGAFLVIVFLFFPLLDFSKEASLRAQIRAGDKRVELEADGKKAENDAWKTEKKKLELEFADQHAGNIRWVYWYNWGMMLGFLSLAIGSITFLSPGQLPARRVVGAIILCAEVLLIFLIFIIYGGFGYINRAAG